MKTFPIYQVDAFTNKIFGGNYAAICPLQGWLADKVLLNIAKENNVAETAFIIKKEHHYSIRWFTPDIEMDLCGHATLASAHVIFNYLGHDKNEIIFDSASGELRVFKKGEILYLDFPIRPPEKTTLPKIIHEGIGKLPVETYKSRDYLLVYAHEKDIKAMVPNQKLLDQINLDPGGIIVTAPGSDVDFVSRFFTPQSTLFEDPVTGSAHCTLIPYWAHRLEKKKMTALQLSSRKGELLCELKNDRVYIGGNCKTYLKGEIYI